MKTIINNRWVSIMILLLVVANIIMLVLLWQFTMHHKNNLLPSKNGGEQAFEFITRELQLTPSQQETYKQLRKEHQEGQREIQDSIRYEKDIFFGLLKQGNITDKELEMQSSRVGAKEEQLDILTFKHFQKLRKICSPQQQNKFDQIIEEVLHRMGPGKGPQGPPPPDFRNGKMPPPPPEGMEEDSLSPPPPLRKK